MTLLFDNIDHDLLPTLTDGLKSATRADFCVGYFNLRGWQQLASQIDRWQGTPANRCRVLIGMQQLPSELLKHSLSFNAPPLELDQWSAGDAVRKIVADFRDQLISGAPTAVDEVGLRQLSCQLKQGKLQLKLHLRFPLHAKLYLLYQQRGDLAEQICAYVGSSNLTLAGLLKQGELNIAVEDKPTSSLLANWFETRWGVDDDPFCPDISQQLAEVIDESWAGDRLIPPYHIYLKMAYHLSEEANADDVRFKVPAKINRKLFEFQKAAVQVAARHVSTRGGVLLGDVVGLGKTLMATAVASIFQENEQMKLLIICPPNLVSMWRDYVDEYDLLARIIPLSMVSKELPELRKYELVILDESHNLRSGKGKRYTAIQKYIRDNGSKCILLSATPYNKHTSDLSAQLRLFVGDRPLTIRPEAYLREVGGTRKFSREHTASPYSLTAFEQSKHAEDWRDLMRLYLVRRTRSFIQRYYAEEDAAGRKYLTKSDGSRSYFPLRQPRNALFVPSDQYLSLYTDDVVDVINNLLLPRYGLLGYVDDQQLSHANEAETSQVKNLSYAGNRLKGFSRTNLFKRLESSGAAFLQSVERHILRNCVFLHALEHGLPLPIGTQDASLLELSDADVDPILNPEEDESGEEMTPDLTAVLPAGVDGLGRYQRSAASIYDKYSTTAYKKRFKWLRADLFLQQQLMRALQADNQTLHSVLARCPRWQPAADSKLDCLAELLTRQHGDDKVLVFTQFADTANYLAEQLAARGLSNAELACVTGSNANPTAVAHRFSPKSNGREAQVREQGELRVLITTDVLSEGQNLQDCAVVVNYDLPWTVIRLVQRVGRIDRIGQQHPRIECYSFAPADGIEAVIHLREKLMFRLRENNELIGTDEQFFEDEETRKVLDLYHEKAGVLDESGDEEVDLTSYAYRIWRDALKADPSLRRKITSLPSVVYSSREYVGNDLEPQGVLLYARTANGNDSLAWIDRRGQIVNQAQLAILRAAECPPRTPAQPRQPEHHELVSLGMRQITAEESSNGTLGPMRGARYRTYERLLTFAGRPRDQLDGAALQQALAMLGKYPLQDRAARNLNQLMRGHASDDDLAKRVIELYNDDRLCDVSEESAAQEPQIICSLGLFA